MNLAKAEQYFRQGRFTEAESALHEHLAIEPENPHALYLLAYSKLQVKKADEAEEICSELISQIPDEAQFHYLMSLIKWDQEQPQQAQECIEQAIAMNPNEASFYGLLASVKMYYKKYEEALSMAEEGLALDAENPHCLNIKGDALTKLGRAEEANKVFKSSLGTDPEDDYTHAYMGHSLLEQGKHEEALEHFKEALRMNPNNRIAKEGIKNAIKAKVFIYRWFLKYAYWLAKQSGRAQMFFIFGIYILYRILLYVSENNPALTPFIKPVLFGYMAFALTSWLIGPLSNLFIRINPYGKYALSEYEIKISNWVSGLLGAGAFSLLVSFLYPTWIPDFLGIYLIALSLPISGLGSIEWKKQQKKLLIYIYVLAIVGFLGLALTILGGWNILNMAFLLGAFASQFYANYLIGKR